MKGKQWITMAIFVIVVLVVAKVATQKVSALAPLRPYV